MTSRDYVKAAIDNVEKQLQKKGSKLPSGAIKTMVDKYKSKLDDSPEFNLDDTTTFQELIGTLRWAMKIGRVDILTELSMLSSYQASPRRGHLQHAYHIFV